eukprot:scaffold159929_cov20-Prasinocladus_malaysianus.AAC.4
MLQGGAQRKRPAGQDVRFPQLQSCCLSGQQHQIITFPGFSTPPDRARQGPPKPQLLSYKATTCYKLSNLGSMI